MSVNYPPALEVDGHRIASTFVDNWTSLTLAGLTIVSGGRTSPTDAPGLPTATVDVLCNDVPAYLAKQPVGKPAIIYAAAPDAWFPMFRGNVDSATVKAVHTRVAGHEYLFRVSLSLVSRPATRGDVLLSNDATNNRPAETMAKRVAWINKALTTQNSPLIDADYHQVTPVFFAPGGLGGKWPYWVAPKDYRGTAAIAAWTELAATAGEFMEFDQYYNAPSALGRVFAEANFTRLGWVGDRVGIVSNPAATVNGNHVIQASQVAMADSTYTDVGSVFRVRNTYTRRTNGTDRDQVGLSYVVDESAPRMATVNTLAFEDASWPDPQRYGGVATAVAYGRLFEDAREPAHPPLDIRFDDGWETRQDCLNWLLDGIYAFGPVYVAGSLFNRLRTNGLPYHARGNLTLTWEAVKGDANKRRWRATLGLTPIRNDFTADLLIKDINPSATTGRPASSITYGTIPGTPRIADYASTQAGDLAARLAVATTGAFTYDDIYDRLSINEFASAGKGL